jgi:ABC-2 type transport system permease protein
MKIFLRYADRVCFIILLLQPSAEWRFIMFAVFKKELRSYFTNPLGYVFCAVYLAVSGFILGITTLYSGTVDVSGFFQIMIFASGILVPIITMKSFAEEKRTKTEQLLLTAPVSLWGMVLAKFLAAFTLFFGTVVVSALYYLVLGIYGEPNWAKVIGCTVGMILIGACFIAIGLFISALTENQFVAAMGTIGTLAGLVVVAVINGIIDNFVVRFVLDWISIYSRFTNFTHGIFDFSSAFYYVSICAVFLFLCVRVYEKRRFA